MFRGAVLVSALALLSGCASLSPKQTSLADSCGQAMSKVAGEERDFLNLYGRLYEERRLIEATNAPEDPVSHYYGIVTSTDSLTRWEQDRKKIEAAAALVQTYGKALTQIASGKYIGDLDTQAQTGSDDVKDALDSANTAFSCSFNSDLISKVVGEAIRSIGGGWLRKKQHDMLKAVVAKADPVIGEIASKTKKQVRQMFENLTPPGSAPAETSEGRMADDLDVTIVKLKDSRAPALELFSQYHRDLRRLAASAKTLADTVDAMADAHAKLALSFNGASKDDHEAYRAVRNFLGDLEGAVDEKGGSQ